MRGSDRAAAIGEGGLGLRGRRIEPRRAPFFPGSQAATASPQQRCGGVATEVVVASAAPTSI